MKNILVKKTAKLKIIIATAALGASALVVNTSLADNWDGEGVQDYHLPSSLSPTITPNQDGNLEAISGATVSGVSEHMTISTAPGLITIPAASKSTTASELSELMAASAGHELMTISDARGDTAASGPRELRRVFDNHGPRTVFDKPDHTAISLVPEPTTIFAGALLLLPLGVSLARNLRQRKSAAIKMIEQR